MDLYHNEATGIKLSLQKVAEVLLKAYCIQVRLHDGISNIKGKDTLVSGPKEYTGI